MMCAACAGTGLNVQERLQQAAASSWVAKATDEPVWMAWAQQSDSLIDEVWHACFQASGSMHGM